MSEAISSIDPTTQNIATSGSSYNSAYQSSGADPSQQPQYNGTSAYDVVGVFDQDFNQLFQDARPMKAQIKRTSKQMKHPAESGVMRTDHRIINPIEITLNMILTPETYVDTYHQIENTFNAEYSISVQTKVKLYENFVISQMPHDEDVEHFDTIVLVLHLEEIRYFKVAKSSYTPVSQKKRGNRSGKAATTSQTTEGETKAKGSVAYGILQSL